MAVSKLRMRCLVAFSLLEMLFFGGLIYGWNSLVFVLKAEGLFRELCADIKNTSLLSSIADNVTSQTGADEGTSCLQQDERFNLIFTIVFALLCVTTIPAGQMYYRLGFKRTRMIITLLYLFGLLLLAFASPVQPWLILPGILFVGIGGVFFMLSDVEIALLLSNWSSIYVSIANGLFDSSVLTQRVVKELFENGVKRTYSFSSIAILMVVISGFTTFCYPSNNSMTTDVTDQKNPETDTEVVIDEKISDVAMTQEKSLDVANKQKENACENVTQIGDVNNTEVKNASHASLDEADVEIVVDDQTTIFEVVFSRKFILQTLWFSIVLLRLVYFLGSINSVMEKILDGKDQVSYFTNVLAYTMMGGCVSSYFSGQLLHWQNSCCSESFRKIVPLSMTSGLAVLLSAMTFITSDSALYGTFIILTIFRSFLFSVNMDFMISSFPKEFVSVLYSVENTIAGVFSFLQYALFVWADEYNHAANHVNGVLLGLSILSFVQPLFLFVDAMRTSSKELSQ